MITTDFWNISKFSFFRFLDFRCCIFLRMLFFIVFHLKLYDSLYEPSRQWLGWQFTVGLKLPGDRKIDFCKSFWYSFRLRQSCGPPEHPEVSWNVSIDVTWRLNEIENVYCLTFSKVQSLKTFDFFFKNWKIDRESSYH